MSANFWNEKKFQEEAAAREREREFEGAIFRAVCFDDKKLLLALLRRETPLSQASLEILADFIEHNVTVNTPHKSWEVRAHVAAMRVRSRLAYLRKIGDRRNKVKGPNGMSVAIRDEFVRQEVEAIWPDLSASEKNKMEGRIHNRLKESKKPKSLKKARRTATK